VFLSRAEVRADAYRRLARWIHGYAAGDGAVSGELP
jgi:hypothetical protein